MTEQELKKYLHVTYPKEDASCELKECKSLKHNVSGSKGDDIISYISAIANMDGGHLIIGVQDKTFNIVGIENYQDYTIENIKFRILGKCTNLSSEDFEVEAITTNDTNKTIWIFHIPKHQPRLPVYAHDKAWQRIGDSLVELRPERKKTILSEPIQSDDWSAVIIPDANLEDLDPAAILKARENYKNKFPAQTKEADSWNDITFLNKAKVTIKGKITRTAIILLGKAESEHFINPAEAKIRWILKDNKGNEKDYQIESCPLLLAVDKIYSKIRNLKYRTIKEGTLFPDEVDQYEPFVIREAINNCIAHQDYTKGGRINVVEMEDQLIFTNLGSFIPGSVEKVVIENAPEEHYRNKFLATAMFNLKMVDTVGGGIRKMFNFQRVRFFPMPEYDLSDSKVKVTVIGKVLDTDFARVLARNPKLSLEQIIALDKVQKSKNLTDNEIKKLKEFKLIEGRKPNYVISAKITALLSNGALKAHYIKHRGLNDEHYKKLIIEYLKKFGDSPRKELEKFLWDKLPDILSEAQKKNKVINLLSALRREGVIKNIGYSMWTLV